MPRPGVDVEVLDEAVEQGAILDTGQGFFAGWTERGPDLGVARSSGDFKNRWGGRAANSALWDDVIGFFGEGGSAAVISRDISTDALVASDNLGSDVTVDAIGAGVWGNDVQVIATYATGSDTAGEPIYIEVNYLGSKVEQSTTVHDVDELIAWAMDKSNYVRFSKSSPSGVLPDDGDIADLAGGGDGTVAARDLGTFNDALDRFTYDLGAGQVAAPGVTDPDYHKAIGVHIDANHRCAVVDLEDTNDKMDLLAARAELDGQPGARAMLAMGHHLRYPAQTPPASVIIPYSGIQMGIIARVDKGGDPAAVAAGANAVSRLALGVSQTFSDADREELNANGVTLGREMFGAVRTYGYRTAAGPDIRDNWTFFQESRVIMAIAHESNAGLEEYVFDTIDGRLHLLVSAKNMLTGICMKYWQAGALYGTESNQAFRVICDGSNNSIDTIKLGEIHAMIKLKTSKIAEWVKLNIVKVPTEQEV